MTNESRLVPCPFCGEGETQIRENTHWTGQRSTIISVEILHWCDNPETNHRSLLRVKGKTEQEAITRWNRRAAPATEPSEVERLEREFISKMVRRWHAKNVSLDGWVRTDWLSAKDEKKMRIADLRGLLERHPDHPELVRLREES